MSQRPRCQRPHLGLPGISRVLSRAEPDEPHPEHEFGGTNALPNTRGVRFEARYPFYVSKTIWDCRGNLTKLPSAHNFKTGVFVERRVRFAPRVVELSTAPSTSTCNVQKSIDTNVANANAVLGFNQPVHRVEH